MVKTEKRGVTPMNENPGISISYEQARKCIKIGRGKKVHSFLKSFCLSGADIDLSRAEEMLKTAAKAKKIFLSDVLGFVNHDIVTWDSKYEQWTFLECEPDKIASLKAELGEDA